MLNRGTLVIVLTLSIVLIGTSAAKLVSADRSVAVFPAPVLVAIGIGELLLAVGLWVRRARVLSAYLILAISIAGVLLSMYGPDKPCGCLGSLIELSRREHFILSCATGALSAGVVALP
jgi:hypothetical protein